MTGKTIHGFRFTKEERIEELSATAYYGVYEKTGTELFYLKRAEKNKTFAISFKTLPSDDTGVFHILEHSVLCGSDKYPVKEPFVELLKGSLKTFLNAFTFPDKTMYPVCSRNSKDFLNLVDVYMDAVLHPLALTNKNVFLQEGWHYSVNENGELSYNGVVYNEMKGAYSSADELETTLMARMLYRDSCYGCDSGGEPSAIPSLTYEQFCDSHKKYYHPSNAKIFLDGDMDIEEVLKKLSEFFSPYGIGEKTEDFKPLSPLGERYASAEYEISAAEDSECAHRLCFGYRAYSYADAVRGVAVNLLADVLAGTNEAPLKKAILASGLCEDAGFISYDGIKDNSLLFEMKNLKEESIPHLTSVYLDTLRDLAENGIDKKALSASLCAIEFKAREQDSGSYPQGIACAISAMSTWLYGADPADGLRFEQTLKELWDLISTDYFENLIKELLLDEESRVTLHLSPSKDLADARILSLKKALEEKRLSMTEAELDAIKAEELKLTEWQSADDEPQALQTLPYLTVEDIEKLPEPIDYEFRYSCGAPVIFTPANTRGITYLTALFDISDFNESELSAASFLTDLLLNCKTESYSAADLQNEIKSHMGAFSFATISAQRNGETRVYFKAGTSFLNSKISEAFNIIKEVFLKTCLSDTAVLSKILNQTKLSLYESICQMGHSAAFSRAGAYTDCAAAIAEYTDGIEYYKWIKEKAKSFGEGSEALIFELSSVMKKIFTRARLTLAYSGDLCDSIPQSIAEALPDGGSAPEKSAIKPLGVRREGIIIPGGVSYSAMGCKLCPELPGYMWVVRSILSYGYLWGAVRVQGGAYGAGFICRAGGLLGFYSFRDPTPYRSVNCYLECGNQLRKIAASDEDFTNFIIGAIGDSDPLITPKLRGAMALALYLRGETYEDRCQRRKEMINTSKEDLLSAADLTDKACADGGYCIIGAKDILEKEKSRLTDIFEI